MGISGVKATENFAGGQAKAAQPVDTVSKGIQDEIENVQREKQALSSKEELSVEEKMKKRKELQQELSSLNAKLRQRQAEVRREQQKKAAAGELRAEDGGDSEEKKVGLKADAKQETGKADSRRQDRKTEAGKQKNSKEEQANLKADKENKADAEYAGMPKDEMRRVVAADTAVEQTRQRGLIIARMEGGRVILKGEIELDEIRGGNVEKKQAELEKQDEKIRQAAAMQLPDPTKPRVTGEEAFRVSVDGAV